MLGMCSRSRSARWWRLPSLYSITLESHCPPDVYAAVFARTPRLLAPWESADLIVSNLSTSAPLLRITGAHLSPRGFYAFEAGVAVRVCAAAPLDPDAYGTCRAGL